MSDNRLQKNMDIKNIRQKLIKYFEEHDEIEVAYLFGSVAKGKETSLSDIDIALLVDYSKISEGRKNYPYGYKAHITADLIGSLKRNDVDIVLLDEAGPLLRHRVVYNGINIYSKNEKRRIQFQVETLDKYNDYKNLQHSFK